MAGERPSLRWGWVGGQSEETAETLIKGRVNFKHLAAPDSPEAVAACTMPTKQDLFCLFLTSSLPTSPPTQPTLVGMGSQY